MLRRWLLRPAVVILGAMALAGCFPDLDWRPLNVAAGHFTVLMPARSKEESRTVAEGVTMHLWGTRAGEALFAAAYTEYPDAAASHLATVQAALVAKGGRLVGERELRKDGLAAREFSVEFPADKSPPVLHVRLLAEGKRLYQLSVLARGDKPAREDIDLFFDSFHLTKE